MSYKNESNLAYNLGQNEKEQLTPFPHKAERKGGEEKKGWFWVFVKGGGGGGEGRGGPGVPFILSKIVVYSISLKNVRVIT